MTRYDPKKLTLGAAIWIATAIGLAYVAQAQARVHREPLGKLGRYLFQSPRELEVELKGPLRVGDPVLDSQRRFLGSVAAIQSQDGGWTTSTWEAGYKARYVVRLHIDPEVSLPQGATFVTDTAPIDAGWVIQTLLPEHKRDYVTKELEAFVDANREEITGVLRPVAEDAIAHGMQVLEQNLTEALRSRHSEMQRLLDKHRVMVKDELLPVLKRELGPSAKTKAQPILNEIGRELWDELPMWSFSWRAFVDKIPGTTQDRTEKWWNEFLETKAIPIVAAHEGELIKILEELIEEGARNPEVRKALSGATKRLAQDPAFKALVRGVLEDALVKPFDARTLIERIFKDPAHQARLQRLQHAFGPTLHRITRRLTTDPETGALDPDLARVLRRVVFHKDARWVQLEGPSLDALRDASSEPAPPNGDEPVKKF